MSINVNVSGNPVRINRGKMVTSYDPDKTEFEKRRLMRLEQVRQQSKDIAENVRNKTKKEKSKCLSEIEKNGEVKLKNWQARKLLELQNQYQEALDEIGLGHKQATCLEDEEDVLLELQDSNEKVARERGRAAADRFQIEKNEESLRKAVPHQRKKIARDAENTRANVITRKNGKSPFKKKKIQQVFDSDGENRVPQLVGLNDESDSSDPELVRKTTQVLRNTKEQQTTGKVSKEQQTSVDFQVPTSDKAAQTILHEDPDLPTYTDLPRDLRISERIKRRARLNPEVDYCDFVDTETTKTNVCICCKCHVQHQVCPNQRNGFEGREPPQEKPFMYDEPETTQKDKPQRSFIPFDGKDRPQQSQMYNSGQDDKTPFQNHFEGKDKPQKGFMYSQGQDEGKDRPPQKESYFRLEVENRSPQRSAQSLRSDGPQLVDGDKNSRTEQDKTLSKTSTVPRVPQKTDSKKNIPSKPKITLRPTKDRPVYIGTETQPVQYYDHPNRYSRSYQPKTSHVEKIDDSELAVSPTVLSEDEIREKMRQRDIEAHIRGQAALEKEKRQREYRDLLKKLPALQKQERICEIGMDKEKYHMSKERLEDLERKRQNRLDNAYEELFVRTKPPIVTLRKKDQDQDQSLNLANWDVDCDPKECKSRTDQLSRDLSRLKTQKDSLLKELETAQSKETFIKSKSTDYSRTKRKRRPVSPTSSDVILEEESTTRSKSTRKGTIASSGATSPSPRKKAKKSKKVLVLQNTSTQTTPQALKHSAATSPITDKAVSRDCTCKKDDLDDLCEIVIKIKDDEKPEVQVNPPYLGRSVRVVTEEVAAPPGPAHKEAGPAHKEAGPVPERAGSWREQLSRSASTHSSSSTTYLEPPKSARSDKQKKAAKSPVIEEISRSMNSSGSSGRKLDPRLVRYIKKLLNMSRASIEDLTVSSASDVSTPTHSLLETTANNPLRQLMNVMKYFNIDAAELEKQLSFSTDADSSKHYNTSESVTVSTSASDGEKSSQFKSCTDIDTHEAKKKVQESNKKLQQYAEIAASCTEKISNLTKKIEKVRAEKKKIIESSASGSEDLTTTSYRDLPDKSQSPKKDDLDKLLTIDYEYAEQLKKLTQEEIEAGKHLSEFKEDHELLDRLKKLLDHRKDGRTVAQVTQKKFMQEDGGPPVGITSERRLIQDTKDGACVGVISERTRVTIKPDSQTDASPIFLDIPKLPRLEAPSLEKKKRRPPPTKGIRAIAAKSDVVPHELSTIIEADSKAERSPTKGLSSETSSTKNKSHSMTTSSDDISEMETMETMLISIGMDWAVPTLKKTRETLALNSSSSGSKESDVSLKQFLSRISSSGSKSGEGSSLLSDSQGISLIQEDQRKTSTPIGPHPEKKAGKDIFIDSDISSVGEHSKSNVSDRAAFKNKDGPGEKKDCSCDKSKKEKKSEEFFELNEGSLSKTE